MKNDVSYTYQGIEGEPVLRIHVEGNREVRGRIPDFNDTFHPYLQIVQSWRPDIISPEIDVVEYGPGVLLRHGSTNNSRNRDVPKDIVRANNCLRKFEWAKGKAQC